MSDDITSRARAALEGVTQPWRWSGGEDDDPAVVFIDAAPDLMSELLAEVERLRARLGELTPLAARTLRENAALRDEVERLRGCPHDSWSGDGTGRWRCDECDADQGSQDVGEIRRQLVDTRAEVERLRAGRANQEVLMASAADQYDKVSAEVERLRGALDRITGSTKREEVAWLLWCANQGYLLRSDREGLTSHFDQPVEHVHPDDRAEMPGWLELADDLLAVLRGDQ